MGSVANAILIKTMIKQPNDVSANAQIYKHLMEPDVSVNLAFIELMVSANNAHQIKDILLDIGSVCLDALDLRNTPLKRKVVSVRRGSSKLMVNAPLAHQELDSMTTSVNASRSVDKIKSYFITNANVLEAILEINSEPVSKIDALIIVISMKSPSAVSASKTSSSTLEQGFARSYLIAPKIVQEIREDVNALKASIMMKMETVSNAQMKRSLMDINAIARGEW